jgi:hypothetical protein
MLNSLVHFALFSFFLGAARITIIKQASPPPLRVDFYAPNPGKTPLFQLYFLAFWELFRWRFYGPSEAFYNTIDALLTARAFSSLMRRDARGEVRTSGPMNKWPAFSPRFNCWFASETSPVFAPPPDGMRRRKRRSFSGWGNNGGKVRRTGGRHLSPLSELWSGIGVLAQKRNISGEIARGWSGGAKRVTIHIKKIKKSSREQCGTISSHCRLEKKKSDKLSNIFYWVGKFRKYFSSNNSWNFFWRY